MNNALNQKAFWILTAGSLMLAITLGIRHAFGVFLATMSICIDILFLGKKRKRQMFTKSVIGFITLVASSLAHSTYVEELHQLECTECS